MNDLEMCKEFASLEGIAVCILGSIERLENLSRLQDGSAYNPITDLALNCKARDKYEVFIDYRDERAFILSEQREETSVDFDDCETLTVAVIECILKSKGIY